MKFKDSLLFVVFIIPYFLLIYGYYYHKKEIDKIENTKMIIINKDDYTLKLYSYKGELLNEYKVAVGKNYGNKNESGDNKTPEGIFIIQSIEDSKEWEFDFENDNLGPLKGAYGPWFIRLFTPGHKGIGIHGTLNDNSLGTRDSHGCIRMNNDKLSELKSKISTNTVVAIMPSSFDLLVDKDTTGIIEKMYLNRLK